MADIDGMRYVENPAGEQPLIGGEEAQEHWPAPVAPTFGKEHGDLEEDHDHHHAKKSALAKFKDKAKKWKHILVRKKHWHEKGEATHEGRIDVDKEGNFQEQHSQNHAAPFYETEAASSLFKGGQQHQDTIRSPSIHKKSTRRHPHIPHSELEMKYAVDPQKKPELHHLNAFKEPSAQDTLNSIQGASAHKPLSEIVLEILVPVCTAAKEVVLEKALSLKEYLMNTLEPGEGERALSQLITDTISPDGEQGEVGVLEKIKEVISSLVRREELTAPSIPVSINPHSVEIDEICESGPQHKPTEKI